MNWHWDDRLQSSVVSKTVAKFDETEAVALEPKQKKLYDALVAANTHSADEIVGLKERARIFKELRKAANHPMLLRRMLAQSLYRCVQFG